MITNKLRFAEEKEDFSPQAVQTKKKRLREYMREKRSQNENRDVKEKLLLENFEKAIFSKTERAGTRRSFFVYLSYSSEAPTDELIEWLKTAGHLVYCPKVAGKEMTAVLYGEDFSISDYGIREPIGAVLKGETDVIVLPLLAVDERGNRLGYGGGFYDRYLREHPQAKRVAYCYDFQIARNVPVEKWDERVDVIVTDKRILFTDRDKI